MNATFLAMAIGAGMTAAIMNPLHAEETGAIKGADVLMGYDWNCRRWLKAYRAERRGDDRRERAAGGHDHRMCALRCRWQRAML